MILTDYFPLIDSNNKSLTEILTSSITEYAEKEQHVIAKQLSHYSGRALHRFNQFDKYIFQRQETEKWLYSAFLKIGGHPNSIHPFYFILGESEQLKHDFGVGAKSIQLDTNQICHNHISFTIGDSVGVFFSSAPNQIYLLNQLENLLSNPELIQWQMKPLELHHQYIEAQLWDKHYLNKAIISDHAFSILDR